MITGGLVGGLDQEPHGASRVRLNTGIGKWSPWPLVLSSRRGRTARGKQPSMRWAAHPNSRLPLAFAASPTCRTPFPTQPWPRPPPHRMTPRSASPQPTQPTPCRLSPPSPPRHPQAASLTALTTTLPTALPTTQSTPHAQRPMSDAPSPGPHSIEHEHPSIQARALHAKPCCAALPFTREDHNGCFINGGLLIMIRHFPRNIKE